MHKKKTDLKNLRKIIITIFTLFFWSNLVLGQDRKDEFKEIITAYVAKSYDSCNVELISQVRNPSNPNQKIIVVPKIIEENQVDGFTKYQLFLLLIDQNGLVLNKFIDPVLYYSDAIVLNSITFDTANYSIKPEIRAFGLRFYYEGSSRVNPSESEQLNLYYIDENRISKVLDGFYTLMANGENNGAMDDSFESEYIETKRILVPTKFKGGSFSDFVIKEKKEVLQIVNDKEKETKFPFQKIGVLRFNKKSKEYKFIEKK